MEPARGDVPVERLRLGEEADPKNPSFATILDRDTLGPYYEPFQQPKEWQLPRLVFDEDVAASNADTAVAISAHVKQSMAEFAIAKLDINDDTVWKSYVDKIDKMGLAQYLSNYQQSYDSRPTA